MHNTGTININTNEYYISYNELLNKKVKESPSKVFIKFNNEVYTWSDIDKGSQIIANDLQNIGIKETSRVGIYCSNNANWIITLFAICKLRATPILLNNGLSAREIAIASNIGDIEYLCYEQIIDKDYNLFKNRIKNEEENKIKDFYLIKLTNIKDRFNESTSFQLESNNEKKEKEQFVILFSSGSTGIPKVVVQSQNTMVYCAKKHAENLNLDSNDKHCLVLPLFHIFGLYTVLLTVAISDGQIIIPEKLKTSAIIKTVEEEKCTALNTVPTLLIAILSNKEYKPEKFNSLRYSIIGGALALPSQIEMFHKMMPNNHIMNSYGLTENYHISITDYEGGVDNLKKSVGKPYDNVEIKIKDHSSKTICKPNEVGEVLIRGFNMCEYYNCSKDNQSTDDGWFYTGDLGYIDNNGYLCLNGRIKDVIIRSGETIMPLQIEAALSSIDGINNVKVIGIPDDFRGEEIVACITLKEGYIFDESDIRLKLENLIALYKHPKYFYVFDELPKLKTGKIDSNALKERIKKGE